MFFLNLKIKNKNKNTDNVYFDTYLQQFFLNSPEKRGIIPDFLYITK